MNDKFLNYQKLFSCKLVKLIVIFIKIGATMEMKDNNLCKSNSFRHYFNVQNINKFLKIDVLIPKNYKRILDFFLATVWLWVYN